MAESDTDTERNPDLDKFNDLMMEALAFADEKNLEWRSAVICSAYHIMEYGHWRSERDFTQVSAVMLHGIKANLIKKMDEDELQQLASELSFTIETTPKIKGRESEATALIISAAQAAVEQLFIGKGSKSRAVH